MERGHADDCKSTEASQTRQLETDQGRRVCQGWAPPYSNGMTHYSLVHVDVRSFYALVSWTEIPCVVRRTCWSSAALSSVRPVLDVCANLQFSCLSKLADNPVEATSEKFKVKSYFREKFRCSRIMVDG